MSPPHSSSTANAAGGLVSKGWWEHDSRTTARNCHVFPAGAERLRRLTVHDARGSTSRHHPAALPRVSSGGHVPRPLRNEYHVPGVRTPVRARTRLFSGCDVRELRDRDRVYRGAGHSGQRVSGPAHRRGSGGRLYCRDSPRLRSGRVPLFSRDLGAPERRHAQTLMSPGTWGRWIAIRTTQAHNQAHILIEKPAHDRSAMSRLTAALLGHLLVAAAAAAQTPATAATRDRKSTRLN